jgi:hypothetical protein
MTHQLTLEIADDLFQPLLQRAKEQGRPVESVAHDCLAESIQKASNGSATEKPGHFLERWAGAISSGVPDAGLRHDDYIGAALYEELREPKQ